jgi:hypothetical protein
LLGEQRTVLAVTRFRKEQACSCVIFRCFRKTVAKNDFQPRYVCSRGTERLPPEGLSRNVVFEIFYQKLSTRSDIGSHLGEKKKEKKKKINMKTYVHL